VEIPELTAKLAEMDEQIKSARLKAEEAQLELELAVKKRHGFARIHCPHPKEDRYLRSCMGYETDTYCGVCNEQL
jgi:hypothetical protein